MNRRDGAPLAAPPELGQHHPEDRLPVSRRSKRASIAPETYCELSADDFACVVEYQGRGAAHVQVIGELDIATAAKLVEALNAALSNARLVVVDLSRLTFIDCTGLGAIVAVHDRARRSQRTLVLSSVTAQVKRLLDITGTAARFEIASLSVGRDAAEQSDSESGRGFLDHDGASGLAHPASATQVEPAARLLRPIGAASTSSGIPNASTSTPA
jgi:anti-anti-sigma factor